MSNKIIELPVITTLDIPASKILNKAQEANLQTAIVIGYDNDGELYFASSVSDGGDVLWLFELAKKALLNAADELR